MNMISYLQFKLTGVTLVFVLFNQTLQLTFSCVGARLRMYVCVCGGGGNFMCLGVNFIIYNLKKIMFILPHHLYLFIFFITWGRKVP